MQKDNFKATIFAAKIVFVAGLIFLFGQFYEVWFSEKTTIYDSLNKITNQSNFLAFLISAWYLYSPYSRIFNNNLLFILIGSLLLTAAIGFWFLLFPIYFINLTEYLANVSGNNYARIFTIFYSIWNHAVTQIIFINFLKKIFSCSNKHHLYPSKFNHCIRVSFIYMCFVVIMYVVYSWLELSHPAYGILSNFNWKSSFKTASGNVKFNIKILLFSMLLVLTIVMTITTYLWSVSVKLNPITNKEKKYIFDPGKEIKRKNLHPEYVQP